MTASTRELLNMVALYRMGSVPYTEESMERMIIEGMEKLPPRVSGVDTKVFLDEVEKFLSEFEMREFGVTA